MCSVAENRDFISDMAVDESGSTLLATSGDGSLVAVDTRQRKLLQRSDTNESELLSLAIVKVRVKGRSFLESGVVGSSRHGRVGRREPRNAGEKGGNREEKEGVEVMAAGDGDPY